MGKTYLTVEGGFSAEGLPNIVGTLLFVFCDTVKRAFPLALLRLGHGSFHRVAPFQLLGEVYRASHARESRKKEWHPPPPRTYSTAVPG